MAKGYWITFYHSVQDPARLAEYGALAGPAIETGGGRFLSRGPAARTFEGVEKQRTVLIEFDSVARSEEHTSELQSRGHLVCRLLLEKKKKNQPAKMLKNPEIIHLVSFCIILPHVPL